MSRRPRCEYKGLFLGDDVGESESSTDGSLLLELVRPKGLELATCRLGKRVPLAEVVDGAHIYADRSSTQRTTGRRREVLAVR
jgi:hypothetical protein